MSLESPDRQAKLEDFAPSVRRIAHDFGNVLTSILGFTELAMAQMAPNAASRRYLEEAHRSARQGGQFIDQLRLFSRPNARQAGFCFVAHVALQERNRLQAAYPAALPLQVVMPADLPRVAIDGSLLREALAPLLDNAYEALGDNGHVACKARSVTMSDPECQGLLGKLTPGPCVEVKVEDDGAGMSPETQHHLLDDLFFSTKQRHRGLGLAVVYGVLHAVGGGLRWLSEVGKGSTFFVYLPLVETPAAASAQEGGADGRSAGERVLVVDDDRNVLQYIRCTLEQAGYSVEATDSPAQALAAYTSAAEPFRLVLSDVLMPHLTGVDLAQKLLGQDANVNLLFMSGHVPSDDMKQYFIDKQFELLEKPFQPERLLGAVREALARDGRRGATTRNRRPGKEPSVAISTTC
jgi:CheY-like chemotaxis protein